MHIVWIKINEYISIDRKQVFWLLIDCFCVFVNDLPALLFREINILDFFNEVDFFQIFVASQSFFFFTSLDEFRSVFLQ